ncbi:MAG: hypothetical protein JWL95_1459 [Gemmatimonadetes bacterium]|nr:hypothetical protein [Gemmatimonadota bacterium]
MKHMKIVGRLMAALCVAGSLQACTALSNVRVAPLQPENSSSNRSMLSLYNPLPFQHRSVNDGALLRAPQDRNPKYLYLGY